MTQGEIGESINTMQQFAEGFASKSPEEQHVDRQAFIMAFAAGLLQEMSPNPPLYPESAGYNRFLANRELRAKVIDLKAQDPSLTMVELLKKAADLLGEMYDELADIEPVFKTEAQMARNTRNLIHTRPDLVDEGFATMTFRLAGLLEPSEK